MKTIRKTPAGEPLVWSAAPTPFTGDMEVDRESVERMVEHHLRLGVSGLFLAGTCGEGMCLTRRDLGKLMRAVARANAGRMTISVQVTDNSVPRILDNMAFARDEGAEIAVIAPPVFMPCPTAGNLLDLYAGAIERSPLPVAIYDLGEKGRTVVPEQVIRKVYRLEKVVAVKDSSLDEKRRSIALSARAANPGLLLLNGYEFDCVSYLAAGYDGLLLGGGVFNGWMARLISEAVARGETGRAEKLQARLNRAMHAVFGGKNNPCWLSGQKKLLVEMGIFRTWKNHYQFPLTAACRRAIDRVLETEGDWLFPDPEPAGPGR